MVRNNTYSELTRWEKRWFDAAIENANMSKDPSTKCGTVIVDPEGKRRIAEGYNGFPVRVKDSKERLEDRAFKIPATVHSEMNAILFAKCNLVGHRMFTTSPPCDRCSVHIIQTGITRVAWIAPTEDYWSRWEEQVLFGRRLMKESGIGMMECVI